MAGFLPHIYDTAMKPLEKTRFEKSAPDWFKKRKGMCSKSASEQTRTSAIIKMPNRSTLSNQIQR